MTHKKSENVLEQMILYSMTIVYWSYINFRYSVYTDHSL